MSRKQKKMLIRIGASAVLLAAAALLPLGGLWRLGAFLIPYAVIGWDILWKAVSNILRGQVFDENFLMALATLGAFVPVNTQRAWRLCCSIRWVSCSRAMRLENPESQSRP